MTITAAAIWTLGIAALAGWGLSALVAIRGRRAARAHEETLLRLCEPTLFEAHVTQQMAELKIEHWAAKLLASSLYDSLEQLGAKNYITLELGHPTGGPLLVTIQRKWGKSPAQAASELTQLLADWYGVAAAHEQVVPLLPDGLMDRTAAELVVDRGWRPGPDA